MLPGIGKYTLLDPAPVLGSDVGNNFFLERSSIGQSRAEQVTRYLQELNSDVKGVAIVKVRLRTGHDTSGSDADNCHDLT